MDLWLKFREVHYRTCLHPSVYHLLKLEVATFYCVLFDYQRRLYRWYYVQCLFLTGVFSCTSIHNTPHDLDVHHAAPLHLLLFVPPQSHYTPKIFTILTPSKSPPFFNTNASHFRFASAVSRSMSSAEYIGAVLGTRTTNARASRRSDFDSLPFLYSHEDKKIDEAPSHQSSVPNWWFFL